MNSELINWSGKPPVSWNRSSCTLKADSFPHYAARIEKNNIDIDTREDCLINSTTPFKHDSLGCIIYMHIHIFIAAKAFQMVVSIHLRIYHQKSPQKSGKIFTFTSAQFRNSSPQAQRVHPGGSDSLRKSFELMDAGRSLKSSRFRTCY